MRTEGFATVDHLNVGGTEIAPRQQKGMEEREGSLDGGSAGTDEDERRP